MLWFLLGQFAEQLEISNQKVQQLQEEVHMQLKYLNLHGIGQCCNFFTPKMQIKGYVSIKSFKIFNLSPEEIKQQE